MRLEYILTMLFMDLRVLFGGGENRIKSSHRPLLVGGVQVCVVNIGYLRADC